MLNKMFMKFVFNKGMKLYNEALTKEGLPKMIALYDALEHLVKASNFKSSDKDICYMSFKCHETMVNMFESSKAKCKKDNYEYINYVRKLYNVTVNASIKMKKNWFDIERYCDEAFENLLKTATTNCHDYAKQLKADKKFAEAYSYYFLSKEFGCTVNEADFTLCKGHYHFNNGKTYLNEKKYKLACAEFDNAEKCKISCRTENNKAHSLYHLQLANESLNNAFDTEDIKTAITKYHHAIVDYNLAKSYDIDNPIYESKIIFCEDKIKFLESLYEMNVFFTNPTSASRSSDSSDYDSSSDNSDLKDNNDGEHLYNKAQEAMNSGDLYEAKKLFSESHDAGYISDQALHSLNQDISSIEDKIKQEESDKFAEEEKRKDEEHRAYYDEMGID